MTLPSFSPGQEHSFAALRAELFDVPTQDRLSVGAPSQHRPRFPVLYGSLRERSYSRFLQPTNPVAQV